VEYVLVRNGVGAKTEPSTRPLYGRISVRESHDYIKIRQVSIQIHVTLRALHFCNSQDQSSLSYRAFIKAHRLLSSPCLPICMYQGESHIADFCEFSICNFYKNLLTLYDFG